VSTVTDAAVSGLAPVADRAAPASVKRVPRDLRLDFFRGLALWFIFIDHIPENTLSWLTVRNYGFSDATEIFVFVSGYTALVAYSGVLGRKGAVVAGAKVLRRVWQLYVAHIMLFVAFTAQISWVSLRTDRQVFAEQMNLIGLAEEPLRAMVATAMLAYRPTNLDVLPLYIVVLASFALLLPLVVRAPWRVLAASAAVYLVARRFDWNLPAYPAGIEWYFDPFMWQLLFYLGAAFAVDGRVGERLRPYAKVLVPLAVAYLVFSGAVALSWQVNALGDIVPERLGRFLYPIDKTTLDPLRLVHFLALAYLVQLVVPRDAAFLSSRAAKVVRRCGENSLLVFCLGTFLSFTARVVLDAVGGGILAQFLVTVTGIALLVGAAYVASWYQKQEAA
jgi:hypothetical protein